ncbi:MAG: integral membrane sensor signal transduction histidine [Prolixibacteraceae bacterium]|nr:MAG: integral membrane sensor signal transduction histidine [Prolixibacteraceae bacterium]
MLLKLNKYSYLIFAVCFFTAAAIIENGLLKKHPEIHLIRDFQEQLLASENELIAQIEKIDGIVSAQNFDGSYFEVLKNYTRFPEETGFAFLVYHSGDLKYWSDRSVSFFSSVREFKKKEGLIQVPNGYYLAKHKVSGEHEIIGLHLIKYNYEHQNRYLKNEFFKTYRLPDEFQLLENETKTSFPVVDNNGKHLFSVNAVGEFLCTENQLYLPGIIYFLGLIILLFYFRKEFLESEVSFFLRLLGLGAALFIIFWLHLMFNIPALLSHLKLFSPEAFALNNWVPSLGDYSLVVIFFTFWMYNFTVGIDIDKLHSESGMPRKAIVVLLLLFAGGLFLLANYLIEILIYNSTISFSLNKIIGITTQSIVGIFSVGLILFAVLFFLIKNIEEACKDYKLLQLTGLIVVIALFLSVVQLIAVQKISYFVLLFFILSAVLASLFSKKYIRSFSLSYLIIFVTLASTYSLAVFYQILNHKEKESQKLFAVTLVTERDPAAEEFLAKIEKQMYNDPAVVSLLIQKEDLREYVEMVYFSGYFRKYIFELYVCGYRDSLVIQTDTVPCISFMESMIQNMGVNIPGTGFYFMDNMNGRISYTGRLRFPMPQNPEGVTIYIDLDSDLLFDGIGFPELLIDKSIARSENYRKFSYAKYYEGELTDRFGNYNYNYYIDTYQPTGNEFTTRKWDGYEHLIYHTRGNNYVIVSRQLFSVVDYLISFPYLFVFYFIMVMILQFIGTRKVSQRKIVIDLKFKIQAAIISIVFVSLLVVALATILYNVEEYKTKHRNDLNEKMKSIAEEIDLWLEDKDEITPQLVELLYMELTKLSNIFRTDINIYGVDGVLLASSRVEIFQRGLVSKRMNSHAFYEIYQNYQYESYFQPEKIGGLSYLSVYKPIINYQGQILGAINLPYFIIQDKYSQEISTFIVAFINLYVLLLLASIVIAVFIANQITRPLVVIQENLQKMQLGKHNEPIYYRRNDEIGSLVKEYNKKVEELAVSAGLLARSERESAWREMAKQVAHEIKNPLTPMKLNIQYLQRAKRKGKEYDEHIERVTAILIEQIDNLSNIATEFSNFAQIPNARNQVFELAAQMKKVIGLFEPDERASIEFNYKGFEDIKVNADREQLSRAIINLMKNAIQSIPENRKGKIKISLNRREHVAIITVSDDGQGIPFELRNKLFSPSFTTKTSGMGLGLAIVKNIVENFSGRVWFETELEKGTTFYIEIPVYENTETESNS